MVEAAERASVDQQWDINDASSGYHAARLPAMAPACGISSAHLPYLR